MKTILKFGAEWCSPCRALKPVIEQLKEEYKDIEFKEINIDEEPELVEKYNISKVPTIIFLKSEEIAEVIRGAVTKSHIQKLIELTYENN